MTSPPPSAEGSWTLSVTMLVAPVKNAAKDFPALDCDAKSVHLDLVKLGIENNRNIAAIRDQSMLWLAENKAAGNAARDSRFAASIANAQASRDARDRTTAGFIRNIQGITVIEQGSTGAHGTVDYDLASALVHSDPRNVTVVPISQYVGGVDY